MSIERKLCEGMGYEHCVLFTHARVAISVYASITEMKLAFLPSNVCSVLPAAFGSAARLIPVSAETGLARPTGDVHVQMYGYRHKYSCDLEIDPLMTGWGRKPQSEYSIVSFGYSKTVDIGGGGALLTNDTLLAREMRTYSQWPAELSVVLDKELDRLPENIERRRERAALWDRHLGDCCIKPPIEQVIPWRVIRRIPGKRDEVAKALRAAGFDAGINYPPLLGVTDPSAVQWGREVINLWVSDDYDEARIKAACEVIKRTINPVPSRQYSPWIADIDQMPSWQANFEMRRGLKC